MIEFSYQKDYSLGDESVYMDWLGRVANAHDAVIDQLGYVFCDDDFVHSINLEHLNHDTFTDIITFDYGSKDVLEGEIYISVDRVRDNAVDMDVSFHEELLRVMSHGLLHMLGFDDHTPKDKEIMRVQENEAIKMFHVKQ